MTLVSIKTCAVSPIDLAFLIWVSQTAGLLTNGVQPGRVEPELSMALVKSRIEASHAQRSCVNSLGISPSPFSFRVAEGSRSGEGFQVCFDRGSLRLQLASKSLSPRARWCEQKVSWTEQANRTFLRRVGWQSLHLSCKMRRMFKTASTFLSTARTAHVSQP